LRRLSRVEWLCIIVILWLATGLRFVALGQVPPALNVDEAVNGYEAYSLLLTGRDEWGNAWPITIRAFNDYRRPAIVYSAIPFVGLFGLDTFAIRATAATWGLLTVLVVYRLARDMFGRGAGALAGLMLAISPWHIAFSRSGREATVAILAVTVGLWCCWRWFTSRRPAWLAGAALAFGLSLYTYNITQAFTPLMLAALALIFAKPLWRQKRCAMMALLIVVLVAAPLIYALASNSQSSNRLDYVTIFRPDEPLIQSAGTAVKQWLGHFAPEYLFIRGDAHSVLHAPGFGQLYAVDALLLPLGLLGIFQSKQNRRAGAILIAWIALGAVPAALTIQEMGTAHSLRGSLGVPAYATLSALGLMTIWNARRLGRKARAALLGALAGALVWNAAIVLRNYFVVYPVQSAHAFEYGLKEVVDYVTAHEDEYDTIALTNWISQPHIFVLFFQRTDPRRFQAEHPEYSQKLSAKLKQWDKFVVGDVDKLYPQMEHGLFVARPQMLPGIKPVQVIYYPDGTPAWKIIAK
jgi:4-amino-4-deoxy-L-arabinose transferase-like glycosyltransferase